MSGHTEWAEGCMRFCEGCGNEPPPQHRTCPACGYDYCATCGPLHICSGTDDCTKAEKYLALPSVKRELGSCGQDIFRRVLAAAREAGTRA